jgi:hypothetical protein
VSLQESEAFLEGALVFIHAGKMKGAGGRARRYDDSDAWRCAARIGG